MNRRLLIFSTLIGFSLMSCGKYDITGMVAGSSPTANSRFAVSKSWNEAGGFKTFYMPGNEYRFYAATDSHLSETNEGLSCFVDTYLSDREAAPFALFLGDALDGKGDFDLFSRTVDPITAAGRSLLCTPGNRDINFSLWNDYIKLHGTASYLFEVVTISEGKDLFICLDTASGTLGTDQRAWLGDVLSSSRGKYRHIIIFTHTNFFKRDNMQLFSANFNLEELYDLEKLFYESQVDMVLSGHDHCFTDVLFKGVRYLALAPVGDREGQNFYALVVKSGEIGLESFGVSE